MIPTVHAGNDFGGLLDYLQKPGNSLLEPLDLPVDLMVEQMKMVAELSARCTRPVKHLTFSAAREDGRLDDATWLKLVDEAERELGLEGHLRIVVRHSDKGYDHIHPFWCTVSAATGHVPPKRWFRIADSEYLPDVGPCALTDQQAASVPAQARKRKSYDAHALTRLQHLCRDFERRHGLRELASPAQAKAAREAGTGKTRDRQQGHRAQRAGDSLMDKADSIRKALDAPTYELRATLLHEFPTFAQWKRLMFATVNDLVFVPAGSDARLDAALHRVGALTSAPSLHTGRDRKLRKRERPTRLSEQAKAIATGSDLFVRTIAKGGPRVDKRAPAHASLGARPIAMFEFDTPQKSNAGRGVQAVGPYRATVRPDGVAYARVGQSVAFIDRGSAIDVFLSDGPDLHAATALAFHRERVPHLLHADLEIVERVRRIADTLERRSARSQRVTQHTVSGDAAGVATPLLKRRSVAKGPQAPIVPDATGNGRKNGQGR